MNKKKCSFFLVFLLSLLIGFTSVVPISAAEGKDFKSLVAELIYYKKEGAETDVLRTLANIKKQYPAEYNQQKETIDYWTWTNDEMVEYEGVAPDGLPTTNTHAFVVLGYQLNEDGTMREELIGRLSVAKASADKYPNSYIVVTGGAVRNGQREADLMAAWLLAEGLPANRIIVENQSNTTVENAQFTYEILHTQYNMKTISMVTSMYHLRRGSLLYYAESLNQAKRRGVEAIQLVGNAGWKRSDVSTETQNQKANSLSQILGVYDEYRALVATPPTNTKLDSLSLTAPRKVEYTKGEELDLSGLIVNANYDMDGFSREITSAIAVDGYDKDKLGSQSLRVTYTENGITKESSFAINVSLVKNNASIAAPNTGDATNSIQWMIALCGFLSIGFLLLLERRLFQE